MTPWTIACDWWVARSKSRDRQGGPGGGGGGGVCETGRVKNPDWSHQSHHHQPHALANPPFFFLGWNVSEAIFLSPYLRVMKRETEVMTLWELCDMVFFWFKAFERHSYEDLRLFYQHTFMFKGSNHATWSISRRGTQRITLPQSLPRSRYRHSRTQCRQVQEIVSNARAATLESNTAHPKVTAVSHSSISPLPGMETNARSKARILSRATNGLIHLTIDFMPLFFSAPSVRLSPPHPARLQEPPFPSFASNVKTRVKDLGQCQSPFFDHWSEDTKKKMVVRGRQFCPPKYI